MRVERLDLTRYGHFTDHTLDFGQGAGGGADLHVVYGPNEAGKSTTLEALIDLLFGMPLRSSRAFLHDYKTLELGARLQRDGAALEIRRFKNSLTDVDGERLDEALVDLHGLTRDSYRARFSFDSRVLEEGSEAMLASRGELGAALFSASAGLPDVHARLDAAMLDSDRFYEPRKNKDKLLPALLAELEGIDARLKTVDMQAGAWRELKSRATSLHETLEASERVLAERRTRLRRRERELAAFGWARTLKVAREALDGRLALRPLDATLLAHAAPLAERLDELRLERDRRERLARLDEETSANARRDEAIRRTLGVPQDTGDGAPGETSTPSGERLRTIERLVHERERLDADHARATEVRRALETRRDALGSDEGAPLPDAVPLRALVATVREQARGLALDVLERQARDMTGELETALAALGSGMADGGATIAALEVPLAGAREEARRGLEVALERVRVLESERVTLADTRERHARERAALGADAGLEDTHAAEVRARRDAAWRAHTSGLDEPSTERAALQRTAREFVELLVADDALGAERLRASERVAELRRLDAELARDAERTATLERERAAAEKMSRAARRSVAIQATALGLEPDTLPGDIERWLDARARALESRARARVAEAELDAARHRRDALSARLREGLDGTLDDSASLALDELLALADERLRALDEAASDAQARRRDRARIGAELKDAERTLADTEAARASWRERWQTALAGHWLAGHEFAAVKGLLDGLRTLDASVAERAGTLARREATAAEQARYTASVRALLGELGIVSGDDPLETLRESGARLAEAQARARERGEREAEIDRAGAELADALDSDSPESALARLASLDREALEADVTTLEQDIERLDAEVAERRVDARRAQDALDAVDGDAAASRLVERRANLLLEIRERASDTLRMRLGRETVLEGLRRYRDTHRGALLDGARDAFVALTGGRYTDLTTRPDDKGGEHLNALTRDGRSLETDQLSDGTRFQLYLALRIAAYREYAQHRTPPPFVADDVMESFDEERTGAALALLRTMAHAGQVIYLTHHRRVVDIARDVTGGEVHVHELPDRA